MWTRYHHLEGIKMSEINLNNTQKKAYDPVKAHEYYENRRAKKQELQQSLFGIAGLTLEKLLDLMKEFLRTANSNPVVGIASALIVSDILYRAKIIDLQTAVAVDVMVGVLDAGQIAGSIIKDIDSIFDVFNSNAGSNVELKPSASTIVYADSSSDSLIKSLMTREGVKG